MIAKFLARNEKEKPTIDALVKKSRATTSDNIGFVNLIGDYLIEKFWRSGPEFAAVEDLQDIPSQNGVYFNGKNIVEFYEQIKAENIPFWNEYSKQTGITEPGELMQRWLDDNGKTSYNFQRTPEEILAHQYLGRGGGCGEYVTVMADVLRAAGIPTKVVFFLKHHQDQKRDELTRIAKGEQGTFGHYMGACQIDEEWKLFDFKWQWNPKFGCFYWDSREGLQHLRHRNNDGTIYIPVTNNEVYTPGEKVSSPNIGLVYTTDLFNKKLNIRTFTQDFVAKIQK